MTHRDDETTRGWVSINPYKQHYISLTGEKMVTVQKITNNAHNCPTDEQTHQQEGDSTYNHNSTDMNIYDKTKYNNTSSKTLHTKILPMRQHEYLLGFVLERERLKMKLSQQELATKVRSSLEKIKSYEQNKSVPSKVERSRLQKVFNIRLFPDSLVT